MCHHTLFTGWFYRMKCIETWEYAHGCVCVCDCYLVQLKTANVQILTISKTSVTALPVVDKCLDCNYAMCMLHYVERVTRKSVKNGFWCVCVGVDVVGFFYYFRFAYCPTACSILLWCRFFFAIVFSSCSLTLYIVPIINTQQMWMHAIFRDSEKTEEE